MKMQVEKCPYCDGKEFLKATQTGYAAAYGESTFGTGVPVIHQVCRDCGSIVRSYVDDPEKLLKKKNRRGK